MASKNKSEVRIPSILALKNEVRVKRDEARDSGQPIKFVDAQKEVASKYGVETWDRLLHALALQSGFPGWPHMQAAELNNSSANEHSDMPN
jgi:predicted nucleic acid-binding protein